MLWLWLWALAVGFDCAAHVGGTNLKMTMIWMACQADRYSAAKRNPIFAHSMLNEAPHEMMQLSGNAPHFSTIAV